MIVRDEAAIIQRCLNSVRDLIDYWVIVDTGSTDDTQDLICGSLGRIPGELHERPWVNYGHNRTQALELAHGRSDHLLLLDADMTVEWDELPALDADWYLLPVTGDPAYRLRALLRSDHHWYSVGSTHEYTMTDDPTHGENLDAIRITHHCDGTRRTHKFEDDLQLLAADLEQDPNNPRTVFYTANTLRDLGRTDEAVDLYLHRAHMGGWDQETFYSLLEAGKLSDDIALLFQAWSYRPTRAEPLYELAWRFRTAGQHAAAWMVTAHGQTIPTPDDILFVHQWIYDWGLEFEYSIACHYTGRRSDALDACDRLIANGIPGDYRRQVERNRELMR